MHIEAVAADILRIPGIGTIKLNERMSEHTSFRLGGPADIIVMPVSTFGISGVLAYCKEKSIPFFVMGNGTNLIVRDKGFRGIVIKLQENFSTVEVDGVIIKAQAGALISGISKTAMKKSLTGIEFAEGIPGTFGGAVVMNAGAYGGEMSQIVKSAQYLSPEGEIKNLTKKELAFGKRTSFPLQNGGIILSAELELQIGEQTEITEKMGNFNKQRREKQPLELPSAGSVFKRPDGYYAGKLIQDCGLKGCKSGGAQVSEKHCGFIVNNGHASSEDVLCLIKTIQNKIMNSYGIDLQTEVKIIGEE